MKSSEKIADYVSKLIVITYQMKTCKEVMSKQFIVNNVAKALTPQFDFIIVNIEESKDVSTLRN